MQANLHTGIYLLIVMGLCGLNNGIPRQKWPKIGLRNCLLCFPDTGKVRKSKVLYEFFAERDDELDLVVGETIEILDEVKIPKFLRSIKIILMPCALSL